MERHKLVAGALEVLREPQQHRAAVEQLHVPRLEQRRHRPGCRHPLAVVARGLGDDRRLHRREPRQTAVEDQVARMLVVVVVVDRHPDVVQHARRPQQLALDRVAVVEPQLGELVEHPQRQLRHMPGVLRVDPVLRGEVQHAGAADVLEQRRIPVGEQALEEDALAQTGLRRLEGLEPARLQHALHHHRSGEDQVRPRGLDPRDAGPLSRGQRREPVDELIQRVAIDQHALNAVGGQAGGALRGRRQVSHRAADPDQTATVRAGAGEPGRARQLLGDVVAQFLQLAALGGPVGGQEALAHEHGAHAPGARLERRPPLDPDELHRPAAEVQDAAVGQRAGVDGGQIAVARLLFAAEHADRQAQALPGALQELARVLRVADRAGGYRIDPALAQVAGPAEVREDVERRQRPGDRLRLKHAGAHHSLADPDRLVDLVGPLPPVLAGHEHDQAERVGAEIDDS